MVKGSERYHDDVTWSEGLVSAAKNVAASVSMLCEAANAVVVGDAAEERLISSAMAVSSSTQQLLIACRCATGTGRQSCSAVHLTRS